MVSSVFSKMNLRYLWAFRVERFSWQLEAEAKERGVAWRYEFGSLV